MNPTLEDLAGLYVLDQLDAGARADFEAHLLHDPGLAALVADLEAGLSRGVHALPQHQPSAATLGRIEARLDALAAKLPAGPTAPVRWVNFARWGLAAAITVSLGTLAVQSLRSVSAEPMIIFVGLDANRNTFTEVPLPTSAKDADARFIQLASLAEKYWEKPGSLPFKSVSTSGDNRGYALFDPGSRQGFIAIEQLPVPGENQRYHLWIIDPATSRVSDAGILPLAGMNRGLYSFVLEAKAGAKSDRPHFFVTVEENSDSTATPSPKGRVVLGQQTI